MIARLGGSLVTLLLVSGCGFSGIANQALPLTKGSGDGAIHATVYLADAANLVPNAEVKVDDITVGSVRKISFDHWRAKVSIALEPGTKVSSDATAAVAQKSLLGAEYLELSAPRAVRSASSDFLADGAVVPLSRTSRYPETEEVLSSLSLVLNGGGLDKVGIITHELNRAIGGREADVRRLIKQLGTFVRVLDRQKADIVLALRGLDQVSRTFVAQRDDLETALQRLPKGVDVLADQRAQLTDTLRALAAFSDSATKVVNASGDDLLATLHSLRPALRELANAGNNLPEALGDLSFPFPLKGSNIAFRGDYINFFATVDVTSESLARDFLAGTPIEGVYSGLTGTVPSGTSTQSTNPLTAPLGDLPLPLGSAPTSNLLGSLTDKLSGGSGG